MYLSELHIKLPAMPFTRGKLASKQELPEDQNMSQPEAGHESHVPMMGYAPTKHK